MSKKMMLLALAVASMAMFALPAAASAQEDHIDGITSFTGTIDPSSYVTAGEPTFTCTGGTVSGTVSAGGTTGALTLDFTTCTASTIFGNVNCHTAGSPVNNTIAWGGTFHVITINSKPGTLITFNTLEYICAGISNTHVEGSVIDTITSPACNVESKTMTIQLSATGSTQNHITYTGVSYDLKSRTGSGSQITTGLNSTWTLASTTAGKVTCT